MRPVEQVGVVGCGVVGAGFAEICARADLDVLVHTTGPESAERGRLRVRHSLDRLVRKEMLSERERDAVTARITFSTDAKRLRDRDFVLEAVVERLAVKQEVFRVLDEVVADADAVLASTTSSFPVMKLAAVTSSPERVLGAHLFNPVPVMELVELTGSLRTGARALDRARSFLSGTLGKQVITSKDRPGFLVNALLIPYLLSAVRMVESEVASAEAVDRSMKLGCAHPMGPLELTDLIGLDVVMAVSKELYEESKEPLHAPPGLLLRMVEAGLLGRKTGQGFHRYA
ncbi:MULTISPECIES: 3-hydroxybutyryl-CoA dehydrogenase [Streptomyces]|uniref:3-hydroxybutyryl-CoA dehydrogenase n=1 Tax=Streptomyces TaxID=1883 RepID=UPI000D14664A|nr:MULTISPECIES: 3-hydroxybutyryl-CoA dehydrogenase [Streptomyces]MBZ6082438.1 3-hydroxybutyryl-CoA dehydrogenase [Streptomyces olivaceus]MBZ6103617.1 3-hydroxybutyryl-CoA dehydrogenase [Streptomyces olivaceus]MBZ6110122.1 3-hydroxybutyryl-CoA dehydrogenase [Streptomyces olivaceus]MBZ6124719.1 3-hydroxybutyryl-CoA dehydrogenase [Streptomyces olivaceus]MBZ6144827.1 3-hydroxybutyryl-CoA dehydrogenase [Streptomyces olivaceus]